MKPTVLTAAAPIARPPAATATAASSSAAKNDSVAGARLADFPHVGISKNDYDPLEWMFDNWARAHMRHRSQARPLPNEVYGGPPSRVIGFHWTDDSDFLAILQTNYGQLKPGPASFGGNYVYVKGFLAYGPGSEDARHATSVDASSRKYERRAASMHVGSS